MSCRALVSLSKRCQNCGVEFACGMSCCWCDEVALDEQVQRDLRERFSDCLCRACLESAARTALAAGASPTETT